jgi:PAS domain S-box-containing protein
VDPSDPRTPAALAERDRTGCFQGELCLRRRDGQSFPAEVIIQRHTDHGGQPWVSLTIRDLTSRHHAERALRQSEEQFHSAFDHAPIGISIITTEGRYVQVNRALCDLVGYSELELMALSFQDITHPEDLAANLTLAGRLWAGEIESYQMEKRFLHKDGHIIWALLTASAIRMADQPPYGIAQIFDITERRNLEAERALMLANEREYTLRLRTLAEMRADLTMMVAHELRAPVSALRMMTYLLETGDLSAEVMAATFAAFKGEIDHLDRLINDVAAVKDAEREDFSVQVRPVPLGQVLESAAAYGRTILGIPLSAP